MTQTSLFSDVYDLSFQFLKDAYFGLSAILEFLFRPLRELFADIAGLEPENFFPNVQFLDRSSFGFVVGTGLTIYIGITLWKYIKDSLPTT